MEDAERGREFSLPPSPLLTIVNGGYRTGSTVAFNIVQQIYRELGVAFDYGLAYSPEIVEEEIRNPETWRVIKCHVWAPMGIRDLPHLKIVYTHRDPVDVMASFLRMQKGWNLGLAEIIRQALLTHYHQHEPMSVVNAPLILDYDHYYYHPRERVEAIAQHLGITLPRKATDRILQATSIVRAREISASLQPGCQDDETLLQGGHVGLHFQGEPGYGEKVIGEPAAKKVRKAALAILQPPK